jgi:hypothetical protein
LATEPPAGPQARSGVTMPRRPFGREPGAFFVSGCAVVIARKLTYGNFVAIPAIAENKNTRRYWEDFWLMNQSQANRSPLIPPVFPCSFEKPGIFFSFSGAIFG